MRWPWRRSNGEERVEIAKAQLDHAEARLRDTLAKDVEVRRQVDQMRRIRQQNQFGLMIAKALRSHP